MNPYENNDWYISQPVTPVASNLTVSNVSLVNDVLTFDYVTTYDHWFLVGVCDNITHGAENIWDHSGCRSTQTNFTGSSGHVSLTLDHGTFNNSGNYYIVMNPYENNDWYISQPVNLPSPTPTPTNYISPGTGHYVTVEGVTLSGTVTSGGTVTITPSTNNQGGPLPGQFKILNTFYEISSTAQFDFPIDLTFRFQANNENQNLSVLHYLVSTSAWEQLELVSTSYDNTTNIRTLTVRTNSLSPFAIVEVDTTAPTITDFQLSPYVAQNGNSSTISVTANDEVTGVDTVTYTITSSSGQETTGSLSFISPANQWQSTLSPSTGVYAVKVTATDFAGLHTTSDKLYLAVYDPSAGFVTGGGSIIPDDATRVGVSSGGKSNFGYEVKYINGDPQGNLRINYKNDDLEFKSTSIEWLTVSGATADFQGQATLNGSGTYTFRAHVVDGSPDQLDIRIWGSGASFDNPTYRLSNSLSGGNVKIHQ